MNIVPIQYLSKGTAVKHSLENFINKVFENKCIEHMSIGGRKGKKTADMQV